MSDLKEASTKDYETARISGRKSFGLEYSINGEYNTLTEPIYISLV